MAQFNLWIGLGYLTRDPELRYTPTGVAVASFAIGINRKWKDAQGNEKEQTLFMKCDAWKGSAEFLGEYGKKGQLVHVTGSLIQEEWEDKQTGQQVKNIKCRVNTVEICRDSKASIEGQPASASPARTANPYRKPVDNVPAAPKDDALPSDDDVPF